MYRRIVVPLDGSSLAETALLQAEDLARITECAASFDLGR